VRGVHIINKLIEKRRTTREFLRQNLKDGDIRKILEAGRWAPSSLNSQPWKFIVVKDAKKINSIIKMCYYGDYNKNPAVLIAVVLDKNCYPSNNLLMKFEKRFQPNLNYVNIAMPALNMAYQACLMGIDSGIKSPTSQMVNKLLGIPKGYECVLIVCLGYKDRISHKIKRGRKPLKDIVYLEKFGCKIKHKQQK